MSTVSKDILQDRQPFDVAWRTIDGLKIRYAMAYCDANNIGFIPWFPLEAGELTRPGGLVDRGSVGLDLRGSYLSDKLLQ
jgi:aryl-alcohol dehydrogenase-like predicted oxidoreductase